MGDSEQINNRASAGADFLEWNLSLKADSSPWSVEQTMTQLLAYETAEGPTLSLTVAAQEDARVIHELGKRKTWTAVAALRGFQAMSMVDTQRELARLNADRLVEQGLPEPPWTPTIGRVRIDGCWWAHDEFDETAIVLCAFSYDGADEHAILAMIDRTLGDGLFRELTLSTHPDSLRDVLRHAEKGNDGLVSEPLDHAHARRLLQDAISTTDELTENREYKVKPVPAAYRKMRALTLARAHALSPVAAPVEPFPGSVEIELLKRSFLVSGAVTGLPRATPRPGPSTCSSRSSSNRRAATHSTSAPAAFSPSSACQPSPPNTSTIPTSHGSCPMSPRHGSPGPQPNADFPQTPPNASERPRNRPAPNCAPPCRRAARQPDHRYVPAGRRPGSGAPTPVAPACTPITMPPLILIERGTSDRPFLHARRPVPVRRIEETTVTAFIGLDLCDR